jgi:DNA-binding MarR family transcriptional regulator
MIHAYCINHKYTSVVKPEKETSMLETEVATIRLHTRRIVQYLGYIDNMFAHIGSLSECYALQKIGLHPMTILELSQELKLEQSSVSRLAKSLVTKDFCCYQENRHDGRSRYLALTSLGKEKLHEINCTADAQVLMALNQFNETQLQTVIKGITLYADALEKIDLIGGK